MFLGKKKPEERHRGCSWKRILVSIVSELREEVHPALLCQVVFVFSNFKINYCELSFLSVKLHFSCIGNKHFSIYIYAFLHEKEEHFLSKETSEHITSPRKVLLCFTLTLGHYEQ